MDTSIFNEEMLKRLCDECQKEKAKYGKRCPFRSISNDYCDEYESILKAIDERKEKEKEYEKRYGSK